MPSKIEVSNTGDIIDDYLSGTLKKQIFEKHGISNAVLRRILRDAGVKTRTREDVVALRVRKPCIARRWVPENPGAIIAEYLSGTSVNALSQMVGANRTAIANFLKRSGVQLRGQSEAELVKWSAMKGDRKKVERQCGKAWEVARKKDDALEKEVRALYGIAGLPLGVVAQSCGTTKGNVKRLIKKMSISDGGNRSRVALGVQASPLSQPIASPYERPILERLQALGYNPVHQMAIGTCNVDIGFQEFHVAVEIERRYIGESKSLTAQRVENIFDRGWWMLIVYAPNKRRPINDAAVAQQIVAFLEFLRSNPTTAGHYGVIGSDGKPFAGRSFDLYGRPRISGF